MKIAVCVVAAWMACLACLMQQASTTFTTTAGALTLSLPTITGLSGLTSTQALALGLGGVGLAAAAGAGAGLLASAALNRGGSSSRGSTRRRGRGRGHRRRGRDVSDQVPVVDVDSLFKGISEIDSNDCGKRYVCQVAALPVNLLSRQHVATLSLFQPGLTAENNSSSKYAFDEAARFGAQSQNVLACAERYAKCKMDDLSLAFVNNAEDLLFAQNQI